jgi:hypothetical protein
MESLSGIQTLYSEMSAEERIYYGLKENKKLRSIPKKLQQLLLLCYIITGTFTWRKRGFVASDSVCLMYPLRSNSL